MTRVLWMNAFTSGCEPATTGDGCVQVEVKKGNANRHGEHANKGFACDVIVVVLVSRVTHQLFSSVTGALGGLAVAMIILGGAFGVVGGYFMFGRQGPQSGIVTLRDMEPF